ncbi:MAG: ATP-dependent zinc metalloprotease FtsH [Candidatus Omnitrophica bacterium]|nr:ATP-dependent zinc metalloprotease FtsH [Candidatus Omnitrophota bacterium]
MKKNHTNSPKPSPAQRFKRNNMAVFAWVLFIMGTLYLMGILQNNASARKELSYSEFYRVLSEDPSRLKTVALSEDMLQGEFVGGSRFFVNIPPDDKDLLAVLRTNAPDFQVKPGRTIWTNLLFSLGPVVLFIAFLWYFSYRGAEVGNRIWSFGKVKARLGADSKEKVTFADVAGVDEAKEELQEVIEFLKDPKKFQRLGGKIPKGVLLVGPPGCGKTLIAKAVAGEANVPFFNISGSDFVEMFVGVGASRVRDLFEQARKAAKTFGRGAIIFIDEIDAVGRLRFSGIGGGHDEREQTLNQLLVEMDGFDPQEGIILIAATNRPDTLDPALLRPGRFDRHVVIDRPDIKGREAILKVHSTNIKLSSEVSLEAVARQTPGFSGADLANLCNEAALLAARYDKESVGKKEMEAAIERVVAGPERKSRVISPKEKEIVSLHEAGHTLVSLLTPEVDPLHKVSIIPRGIAALGYTLQLPLQDRYIMMKSELIGRITVLLAGRASESLYFQDITTGSENDIEVATQMARRMVCEFGMSEKIGYLTLGHRQGLVFLGKNLSEERNYSEETARLIDSEIKAIIDTCYDRAKSLLEQNKDKLTLLASTLREREVMDAEEVKKLLGFA